MAACMAHVYQITIHITTRNLGGSQHISAAGDMYQILYATPIRYDLYIFSVNMHSTPETYYIGTVSVKRMWRCLPEVGFLSSFCAFWSFYLTDPGPDGAGGPRRPTSRRSGAEQGVGRHDCGPVSDDPAGKGRHRHPGLLAGDWAVEWSTHVW